MSVNSPGGGYESLGADLRRPGNRGAQRERELRYPAIMAA